MERFICLKSPILSVDPKESTQVIRTNFLAFCFSLTKYKFANKRQQRIILEICKYSFFPHISFCTDA